MDSGLKFTRITLENYPDYNELVSTFALKGLDRGETFGLGVVDGDILPVAVLLFSYEDEVTDDGTVENEVTGDGIGVSDVEDDGTGISGILNWIYVRDEYRGMGIAGDLFALFADTVREAGVKTIKCQVRAPFFEAENLGEFFEKCGFKARRGISKDILLSWNRLHDAKIMLRPMRVSGIEKLFDLGNIDIRGLEQQVQRICKKPIDFHLLDKGLSLVCFEEGNAVSGVLLVNRDRFGNIEPVLLRAFSSGKDAARTAKKLFYAGVDSLLQERYEGMWVKIDMAKEKTVELMTHMFPSLPSRETLLYTLKI